MTAGAVAALALGVAACGGDDDSDGGSASADGGGDLSGTIQIDGSSTVAPLAEVAAELFQAENPDVRVVVGTSGTGGGFEKFCVGETDVSDASRQIEEDEVAACEENGIEFEEIQVANDGLTVVVNPENPVECMTVEQLNQVWDKGSNVSSWSEIDGLDADFSEDLELFGPGTDSGTFDYFTEAINGEEGQQRTDYNNVGEDDNQTVRGVSGSVGGMGYFGLSFAQENEGTVKPLQIDGGDGCVEPSTETVQDGSYQPLGRGLFMYPSAEALQRPEVLAFLEFYIANQDAIAEQALFVPLTEEQASESQTKVDELAGS
ncbi:MAG TPA: phosphate ABC transporter substrate-binding protein PstS family protein [Solirubrobacterales bacterium]|nr:phosphate ABC transporter substrate-binding protein PstS family protein [Solirubrobacterales bacterium]